MLGEEVPGSLGPTEPQQRVCEGGASVVGLLGPVKVHEACSGLLSVCWSNPAGGVGLFVRTQFCFMWRG